MENVNLAPPANLHTFVKKAEEEKKDGRGEREEEEKDGRGEGEEEK